MGNEVAKGSPAAHIIAEEERLYGHVQARVAMGDEEDGSQTQWGEVIAWEPPSRLVLTWQVGADWKCDPDLHTEVEVRFVPEGDGVITN